MTNHSTFASALLALDLTLAETNCLLGLISLDPNADGHVSVSLRDLAKHTHQSTSATYRGIKRLVESGVIAKTAATTEHGGPATNSYRINDAVFGGGDA